MEAVYSFGFCQAQDADENFVICHTENHYMLDSNDHPGNSGNSGK